MKGEMEGIYARIFDCKASGYFHKNSRLHVRKLAFRNVIMHACDMYASVKWRCDFNKSMRLSTNETQKYDFSAWMWFLLCDTMDNWIL